MTVSIAGKTVPRIGQGTWYMGDHPSRRRQEMAALRAGIDAGMTLIDTAEMYGDGRSELLVGEAIAGRRDDVYLVSKVLPSHASRSGVRRACQESLRRLRTDHLDLYLYHWRGGHPLEETVAGLEDLVDAGAIAAWGVSNFDVADMEELLELDVAPATNQVLYNLLRRGPELDLLPLHRTEGINTMAYSPIEQGRLFGARGAEVLEDIAAGHGVTPSAVALAWAVRDGETCAIPKSGNASHTLANAQALTLTLRRDELAELDLAFPAPVEPVPLEML